MNGILPLWKERGMTSHDCVFKLRKILRTKRSDIQGHWIQVWRVYYQFVLAKLLELQNI